jgi:hypothetical protein
MDKVAIAKLSKEFNRAQRDLDAFKKSSRTDAAINTLQQVLDVYKRSLEQLQAEQPSGRKVKAKAAKKKAA